MAPNDEPRPGNMKVGLQAFGFLILIVAFNGALFGLIDYLSRNNIIGGGSFFLALVLFLSFTLSVAILLIVALGERISTENIENEWIKKIGVTPILVVVAVLISVAVSFSPLADKILPIPSKPNQQAAFMLADLGVTCITKDENKSPQATHLLTVISSADDEEYMSKVKAFLKEQKSFEFAKNKEFKSVTPDSTDEFYKLLHEYVRANRKDAGSLATDINHKDKWTAYTVEVRDPLDSTFIPIPTLFGKSHRTRLFVVIAARDPLAAAQFSTATDLTTRKRLLPLFSVNIAARKTSTESDLTKLEFQVFTDHICWQIGG